MSLFVDIVRYSALASLLVYLPFIGVLFKYRGDHTLGSGFFHLMISNGIADVLAVLIKAFHSLQKLLQIRPLFSRSLLESTIWLSGNFYDFGSSGFPTVATLNIIAVAWNRYDALVNPVQHKGKWDNKFTMRVILATWVVGLGVYTPLLVLPQSVVTYRNGSVFSTSYNRSISKHIATARFGLRFGIQAMGVVFLTWAYWHMTRAMNNMGTKLDRATRRLTFIGFLLGIPLFIMAINNFLFTCAMIVGGGSHNAMRMALNEIHTLNQYVLFCQNPFTVFALSGEFRRKALALVGIKVKPGPNSIYPSAHPHTKSHTHHGGVKETTHA